MKMPKESIDTIMFAPCGMNCLVCYKLRYNKLTEEEKQWLTRIVQKSELTKSDVPQRGKKK